MSQARMKRLLNGLGQYGVLLGLYVDMRTGDTGVWVEDECGYATYMTPGTAQMHLYKLECAAWGL